MSVDLLSDLADRLTRGNLQLDGGTVGDETVAFLTEALRATPSLSSARLISSDASSLVFAGRLANPASEVTGCLYDVADQRHLLLRLDLPVETTLPVFLQPYVAPPPAQPNPDAAASLLLGGEGVLASMDFLQNRLLFSSLDLADADPGIAIPPVLEEVLPREQMRAGLNFPVRASGGGVYAPVFALLSLGGEFGLTARLDGSALILETGQTPSSLDIGGLHLAFGGVAMRFDRSTLGQAYPVVTLEGAMSGGGIELEVCARLDLGTGRLNARARGAATELPSPADFASLLGLGDLTSLLPANSGGYGGMTLEELSFDAFLSPPSLAQARVVISTENPVTLIEDVLAVRPRLDLTVRLPFDPTRRSQDLQVLGEWKLGKSSLSTALDPIAKTVDVWLGPGAPLDVDAALEKVLPGIELPDIEIMDLDLFADYGDKSFEATLDVATDWTFDVGGTTFAVRELDVSVAYANKKVEDCSLEGKFTIAGLRLDVTATYDRMLGWTLRGATETGETIRFADLYAKLSAELGADGELAVPDEFLDLAVKDVAIQYQAKTGKFSFYATLEHLLTLDGGLSLDRFFIQVDVEQGVLSGAVNARMTVGGISLFVELRKLPRNGGWYYSGSVSNPKNVGLKDFMSALNLPDADGVAPDIAITKLEVDYHTGTKAFDISAELSLMGDIPLGPTSFKLKQRFRLQSGIDAVTRKRTYTGAMEADLLIGKSLFAISYAVGTTTKKISARWQAQGKESLGFEDLAEVLGLGAAVDIPSGLDLALMQAAFEYDAANGSFKLSAKSKNYGDAFFAVAKGADNKTGFIFGVDFPPARKLSDLPGIGQELKDADFLTVSKAGILISTGTFQGYSMPALPPLPTIGSRRQPGAVQVGASAGTPAQTLAGGATLQLTPGISLIGILELDDSAVPELANLQTIVGTGRLTLQATFGSQGVILYAGLAGEVSIPAGSGSVKLSSPAIRIEATAKPVFLLTGGIQVAVNGALVTATAGVLISQTQAQVALTVKATGIPLPPPPGLKGLRFLEFGLQMGVFFQPPGVDLGVTGRYEIGSATPRDNRFGMVLQLVGNVPNVLYLSFSAERMSLGEIVRVFTDCRDKAVMDALEAVKASDVRFYWAESMVTLPDGTSAAPGFAMSATLDLYAFQAHGDIEISATKGLQGSAQLAPINLLDVLKVEGDGKGIKQKYEQIEGQWRRADNRQIVRPDPAPASRTEILLPAGGVVVELNTLKQPFIHASARVSLFDLTRAEVTATLDKKGITFQLMYELGKKDRALLDCVLSDWQAFDAKGSLKFRLKGTVGPIKVGGVNCGTIAIDAAAEATLHVELNAKTFLLEGAGRFEFEGLQLEIPHFALRTAPSSLQELPGVILKVIDAQASKLFDPLVRNGQAWANAAARGLIQGYEDATTVLHDVGRVAAAQAARALNTIGRGADDAVGDLKRVYKLSAKDAAKYARAAGYAADEVGDALNSAYGAAEDGYASALKGAGYAAEEVGDYLEGTGQYTDKAVSNMLESAGYVKDKAGKFCNDTAKKAKKGIKRAWNKVF